MKGPVFPHLVDGVRAMLLRPPRGAAIRSGLGTIVALVLLYLVASFVIELATTPWPVRFSSAGVLAVMTDSMLTLIAAWVLAVLAERREVAPGIASILLSATIAIALFVHWPLVYLASRLPEQHAWAALLIELVSRGWWLLVLLVVAHWLAPHRFGRTLLAAVLAYAVSAAAWWWMPVPSLLVNVVPDEAPAIADGEDADATPAQEQAEVEPAFDAEQVMYGQVALLDAAIARVLPQRPGVVDLYVVAFGGDAQEDVFRNEAEYAARLFASRFDAEGRTLVLANNPATLDHTPLATWTALHRSIEGVARVMDPAEDILLVYLTTHGAEEHQLLVDLDPLPLNQIVPEDLADAFATAPAVRWKVVIVNACFSGGFIDALRDDSTMVLTAARADRSSFGCGMESEITYFGKAFLADALNRTTSLREAFDLAKAAIREWELADGVEHSEPQIASSPSIEAKLEQWRARLPTRAPLPFNAAEPP